MGKSRMMGAGHASSTLYKCSPNLPTGGGNKKQGITSRVGLNNWENREVQTQSNGIGRFKLHFMNQLGGVEPGHSMFGGRWNRGDGLMLNLYTQQVEEKIKQDRQNNIYPNNDLYFTGGFDTIVKSKPIIVKASNVDVPIQNCGGDYSQSFPIYTFYQTKRANETIWDDKLQLTINAYVKGNVSFDGEITIELRESSGELLFKHILPYANGDAIQDTRVRITAQSHESNKVTVQVQYLLNEAKNLIGKTIYCEASIPIKVDGSTRIIYKILTIGSGCNPGTLSPTWCNKSGIYIMTPEDPVLVVE